MHKKEKHKIYILALDNDEPEKELEFEIQFQRTLSVEERYDIMDQLVRDGLELAKKRGYKNTPSIVTRT